MKLICKIGIHKFIEVKDTMVHKYYECEHCNKRKIVKVTTGFQPIDSQWIETGIWTKHTPPKSALSK